MKSTTGYTAAAILSLASAVTAAGPSSPPAKAKVTQIEDFKWANPFTPSTEAGFTPSCEATKQFAATAYTLHDLFNPQPRGLLNWAESLKNIFSGRPYPGDWSGLDPHLYNRHVLKMKYSDVPVAVREWIEDQEANKGEGKGLYAVYPKETSKANRVKTTIDFKKEGGIDREADEERVVIFAPGAMYDILPLWLAEGSECKDQLLDLSKYSETPADNGVISWITWNSEPNMSSAERGMEFKMKAQVLSAKPAEEAAASSKALEPEEAETPAAEPEKEAEPEPVVEEKAQAKDEL